MKSPFPGMDPYLEGYLWPDVHSRLAAVIAELVGAQIAPKYVARIELYTVSDTAPEEDIGIMYPDVEVFKNIDVVKEPASPLYDKKASFSPPTIDIPTTQPIEVRIPVIEIRDRANNQLITAIEILSPVNKRKPGLLPYREKRDSLHYAGVHLLEIDLLRRGTRPFNHPAIPQKDYLISLMRAGKRNTTIWGFDVKESLPVVPVPLKAPDPDAILNLEKVLGLVYQRGFYHLSIDYKKTPPKPAFLAEIQGWMQKLLSNV